MPTLIMMHGMTGTAEMMQPFAEKILPEGWTLLVPDARFNHPRRGKTWWRYEDEDPDVTRRLQLSRRELMDVDSSLSQLEKLIAEEAFNSLWLTVSLESLLWGRDWFVQWSLGYDSKNWDPNACFGCMEFVMFASP